MPTRIARSWRFAVLAAAVLLVACGGGSGSTAGSPAPPTDPARPGDTTAPTLTIQSPVATGSYASSSASLTIRGRASDNVGVTQVSWRNDRGGSGQATLAGGATDASWSADAIALQAGTNTVSVTARDAAGNTTSNAIVISYGGSPASTFYISPSGSDGSNCLSAGTACKTFATVFSKMAPGDELIMLDGVYSAVAGTGSMHWNDGPLSAQIPSGHATRPTYIHALNPGQVTIQGPLFAGRSSRKDSYITVQGLTFKGGVQLYNTSFITLKDVGIHGPLSVGTNDHDHGNTDNLIEDVWVWAAQQRVIAINYRAHRNVYRRMVVRGDGCGTAQCSGSGNPNVGFTVYDSHDVSVQNVMVLDRVLAASDSPYADFAIASHTGGMYTFGRNEWLGTLSLNAPDQGYYMEPDVSTTESPTVKLSHIVAWNAASGGFNLARSAQNNTLENMTLHTRAGDGLRVAPELAGSGTLANVLIAGLGRYALNSSIPAAFVNLSGAWTGGTTNQTVPLNAVNAAPGLRHITRIEAGSPLKGAGSGGADIGANLLYRYGTDGKRFGEPGYNTLGTTPLWPWPNEDRIKREMATASTRGFCSPGKRLDGVHPISLTSYIWEALGYPTPYP